MANMYLKKTILQVVDNQLCNNDPPVTKSTYERLQFLGYSKQQSKGKIAAVLIEEMYDILKENEPFNESRYIERLESLE